MSSTHSDAPSRPSVSESAQGPDISFDGQLKTLTELYLGFFQERKRIEEVYTEALYKLHRKAKDATLADRSEPSSTRTAWREVVDNVEREAQSRGALIETITTDLLNPLMSLRETQDRIRKRIKEDLKDANSAHADFRENKLPRLKRDYLRKCQEVEDYKLAAAAPSPLSPTISSDSAMKTTSSVPTRPVVTSPQPLRPLERRPSGSVQAARNRSPSSSTALQDLAHQGKRQLNQLMTFLDKGATKEPLGGRSDNNLRTVRAKREADEADKEYRKAVHWLETLRLRKIKIVEAGYNSLETFVRELCETLKVVLMTYSDNMNATLHTQSTLFSYVRNIVSQIAPEKDVALVSDRIDHTIAREIPHPVYYYNYNVGECRDLIFGVSLVDYATARGLSEGEVPKIIEICIKEVEQRGLDAEGIYRVSGRHAAIQELQHKIERNEATFSFNPASDDVYAVSSLLKLYLRSLPEPVFKVPLPERVQHTEDLDEQMTNDFVVLRAKMRRLPPIHQATLKLIVEHLARVASRQDKNKMDSHNLAIVFGPVIFGEDELPKSGDLMTVQSWKDTLMEDLISNAQLLFQRNASPPLPPAPSGEPVPPIMYGSSHTKIVANPMLPPSLPRHPVDTLNLEASRPSRPNSLAPQADDFTPQLPPRPANSIHPSLRSGPMSASTIRRSLPPPPRPSQWADAPLATSTVPDSIASIPLPPTPLLPPRPAGILPDTPPLVSPWDEYTSALYATNRPVVPDEVGPLETDNNAARMLPTKLSIPVLSETMTAPSVRSIPSFSSSVPSSPHTSAPTPTDPGLVPLDYGSVPSAK